MLSPPRNCPLLLGHRGARYLRSIPENTFPSFDQALADGCDGFEFDVRLTADGEAVVCHDRKTVGIEIAVASAQELPNLPRLKEVLSHCSNSAFLDIELKVPGLEKMTAAMLQKIPIQRGFVVSSFLPNVLTALRAEDPAIPLGLICETRQELMRWNQLPVTYVIPHYRLVDADLVRRLKAAAKKVLVWTVNDSREMERISNLGVDGIISDDTKLLTRVLRP